MQRAFLIFVSLGIAVLLLTALLTLAKVDFALLLDALKQVGLASFALIVLATAIILVLSACKWKLTTETLSPETIPPDGRLFVYFFYTCLGGLVGQFLPPHISSTAVRSLGLRLDHRTPIVHGASTSLVEQVFDIMIPLACLGPGLLLFLGLVTFPVFLISSGALLAAFSILIVALVPKLATDSGVPDSRQGFLTHSLIVPQSKFRQFAERADRRLLVQLCLLSVMRFAALALRAMFVVWAAGLAISHTEILSSLPFVQLSFLIALTPAGIGIVEWTWTGLLYGLGVGLVAATEFALIHRILAAGAVLVLTLGLCLLRPLLSTKRGLQHEGPASMWTRGQGPTQSGRRRAPNQPSQTGP